MSENNSNNKPQPPETEDLEFNVDPLDLDGLKKPEETQQPPPADNGNQVDALQKQLNEAKDQMMRALAEAENTRKRAAKERMDAGKFAIAGFARELIDVADNLRRALNAIPDEVRQNDEWVKNLFDGVEATERTLLKAFDNNKVRKIDPMGEMFDPNFHEVMFETPMPGKAPGTVIQVLETGYVLNDRLLRPARVGVVKNDGTGGNTPPPMGGRMDEQA